MMMKHVSQVATASASSSGSEGSVSSLYSINSVRSSNFSLTSLTTMMINTLVNHTALSPTASIATVNSALYRPSSSSSSSPSSSPSTNDDNVNVMMNLSSWDTGKSSSSSSPGAQPLSLQSPLASSLSLFSSLASSLASSGPSFVNGAEGSSYLPSASLSSSSEVINLNESYFTLNTTSNGLYSILDANLNQSSSSSSSPSSGTTLDGLIPFWEQVPYPKSGYTQLSIVLLAFFITIIMILVVVGNLLVCIAITTEKSLKTVQNWFIASLAVSDLLLGLVIMPFSLGYELMGYWIFGQLWCDIHHALDVLLCTASINNLCLISLDRYWSVTQAVEYLKKRTPSRAMAMICFVWVFSALVSLPPLVGWKKEMKPGECELSDDSGYVIYSAFGSFYIPAVVMVFVYVKIFLAARSRARKHVKKRKFLVHSEVTNDPVRDKSTTTTTCTSLSNPSPPDGLQTQQQTISAPSSSAPSSTEHPITITSSTNVTSQCYGERTSSLKNRDANNAECSDDTEKRSNSTTPTTPTTPTPKVTFSPTDIVYEDNKEKLLFNVKKCENEICRSSKPPSNVSPTTLSPPQIVIENLEIGKQVKSPEKVNCATPTTPPPPATTTTTTSDEKAVTVDPSMTRSSSSCCPKNINTLSTTINTTTTTTTTTSGSCNNSNNIDDDLVKKKGKSETTTTSTSLRSRKCPKLRISIRGSSKKSSKNDCQQIEEREEGEPGSLSTISVGGTVLPSILRQNGGHPPSTHTNSGDTRMMLSGDDDSDAIDSPISKTSGSVALETKLFLSAPKLARSPYGSSMSIADYDDSDLCNESGESDGKTSSLNNTGYKSSPISSLSNRKGKRKGKVQYQTPPTSGYHTPSDAERHRRKVAKARERRATLILGLIMGSFILAWLPFFVAYLLYGLCKTCVVSSWLKFGYWLGYCNSAINPIIYTVFNRDFRKAFRKILFK